MTALIEPASQPSHYFEHHVFFCLNVRTVEVGQAPRACCGGASASAAQQHAKQRIKTLQKSGAGAVRINQAGCLDRCEQGPCLVVYPQGTWYTYVDTHDIDAIIDEHILGGQVVQRLCLDQPKSTQASAEP